VLIVSGAYIYILGSPTGPLYIGVTSNLSLRVTQHKECTWEIQCVSQQILLSGFGGRKAPSRMGKISTAEVLRLRATSAVSRDKSVRRCAQDDDSVGVSTKNIPNKLALMTPPWLIFSCPRGTFPKAPPTGVRCSLWAYRRDLLFRRWLEQQRCEVN
jgi:hypothetical protein